VSIASKLLGTAAAVTLVVASAARPVSAAECAVHGTCCFPVKADAARWWKATATEVVFERITVSDGGVHAWEIRRALLRQAAPIAACFERDGAAVTVSFVIAASGHVIRADATPNHSMLATCVAATSTRVTFPATRDRALTRATVTIVAKSSV
jgi:hypothetical protein